MNRYTLRRADVRGDGTPGQYMLLGTYSGSNETEAFDAYAREQRGVLEDGSPGLHYPNFETLCEAQGVSRDFFRAEKVKG